MFNARHFFSKGGKSIVLSFKLYILNRFKEFIKRLVYFALIHIVPIATAEVSIGFLLRMGAKAESVFLVVMDSAMLMSHT